MDLPKLFNSHFSNLQICFIGCALCFGLISIFLFRKSKYGSSVLFLLLSGVILRLVASTLDPFLWTWDEQFHALVAKNMMINPLKPMLLTNPVLDYDFTNWKENHIWLHKQPLFLWQIALFFKVLGTSEFVLRLPTVLMMSAMILLIYRIGKLTTNRSIAWYGAFIYTYTFYFIQFVTGYKFTDHNDSAFIFYVTLSIWSWLEYSNSKNARYWLFLIGFFSGLAILNKWVVGLLVYSGWLLSVFFTLKKSDCLVELKNLGTALLTTIIVALPWQLFILFSFPIESHYEFDYNSRHFFEPLEGHGETWYYHFSVLSEQYGGDLIYFIILPGLFFYFKSMQSKSYKIALIAYLLITYLFFTIAATKTPMFCTIVCPILFLGLGAILDKVIEILRKLIPARIFGWFFAIMMLIIAFEIMDLKRLDTWHSNDLDSWKTLNVNAIIDKQLAMKLKSDDWVVFNCEGNNATMFMFYTGKTAYRHYPNQQQYLILKSKSIKIATFSDENLPEYLRLDPSVLKIHLKQLYY